MARKAKRLLTDDQWALIEPVPPKNLSPHRRHRFRPPSRVYPFDQSRATATLTPCYIYRIKGLGSRARHG